ncbi:MULTISPECIES: threonine/serine dehydratase [unclassified Aureimonas]|uniref:threonine ammonia-lyase n=1 Tax=unclassified Aureimonas TaxID=2615206 RepID=UPI0006FD850C|nr:MULTISPECIES: threonine/serine dehydratase [unclassified Aureimonas]KQT62917.1 pyridoxal-5'-phosphate-dependent protein [Aureimonas sp. Leaf427]KQT74845.1 pyridoxal-5'-phosphate-dependent protein [Aureimonas sp. Leaf460]
MLDVPSTYYHDFNPTLDDVRAAHERIRGKIVRTPLLRSERLDDRLGGTIWLKAETLQTTGSFKFRGALNRILQFDEVQRKNGIVAWSSGNHALALSYAASRQAVKATILMPQEAPKTKIDGARANGAVVRLYDKTKETREAIGAEIAATTGAVIVPPYDDPDIILGAGTVGLEIVEQAEEAGIKLDAVLACCSGGGLVAGTSVAVTGASPGTAVYSVEPADFDDMARSLASGKPQRNDPSALSICDALLVPTPGFYTLPVCSAHLAGGLSATDTEVIEAVRFAYSELKLVVEPGGAVALAAVLSGKLDVRNKNVAVILSGGNVDPDKFASYIA